MPLNARNVRHFHRTLYAGMLESVTLLKRSDDQNQGVVTSHKLFQCRWSRIFGQGEQIQRSMRSADTRMLHVPRVEMDRVGVAHINAADRFVDKSGRTWQPEAPDTVRVQLFEMHWCVACRRADQAA